MNKGNKNWENIHSPAFFQLLHVDFLMAAIFLETPVPVPIRNHYFYFLL